MEIESARIFVKVVQLGSFTKAANQLKLPKSTISRTVSRLEIEAGTKLLRRTTRSMTLTPAGKTFFERCIDPVQALEDARKHLHGRDSLLSGHIRLTAPEDLGADVISSVVSSIVNENQGLTFELHYTDEIVDLIKDGFDMAVRVGKLRPSRYKARLIGTIKMILVASPQYLKNKIVKTPQDLGELNCLSFSGLQEHWKLTKGDSQATVRLRPVIVSNQMTTLLKSVRQSVGIALLPLPHCRPYLNSGELVRVLPQWEGAGYPVSIVLPPGNSDSARIKKVADQIGKAIKNSL